MVSYTILNDNNTNEGTYVSGLNGDGTVVGSYEVFNAVAGIDDFYGFIEANGTFTTLTAPNLGTPNNLGDYGTFATGINNNGVVVGFYENGQNQIFGFSEINNEFTTLYDSNANPPSNASGTEALGINNAGTIVGTYYNPTGTYGFIDTNGSYVTLDYPNATTTELVGINNAGTVIGNYSIGTGSYGFVETNGTFITINNLNANAGTYVTGINNTGTVVGYYVVGTNTGSNYYDFTWRNGIFTTISVSTPLPFPELTGINDSGTIVGEYGAYAYYSPFPEHAAGFVIPGVGPLAITAPHSATAVENRATTITGVSVADTASAAGVTVTVTLSDASGDLSATGSGISGAGTTSLAITGSLSQVNSDLATLKDTGGTTPSDTITLNATDSLGNIASPQQIAVTVVAPLFTTGPDNVNFNALTADQLEAVSAGSDLYNTLAGNDVVVLPNVANYQLTSSVAWNPAQLFTAGSGNDQITDGNGSYNIDMGSGTSTVTISGNGGSTVAGGTGNDTITIIGNGDNTINTGTGPDFVSIDGTGTNTINGDLTGSASITGGGTLVIQGNLDASASIGSNSTLEIVGSNSGTVNFLGQSGTLELGDPADFTGTISGAAVGDDIVLQNTSQANGNAVVAATIGNVNGSENLEITESNGKDVNPAKLLPLVDIPISGLNGNPIPATGTDAEFFGVTQSPDGPDTILTLAQGNPVDDAVDGTAVDVTGAGITIGIISDSFNALGGEDADIASGALPAASDIDVVSDESASAFGQIASYLADFPLTDEGRAMAQIVHDIAPDADIDFASAVPDLTGLLLGTDSAQEQMAKSIASLVAEGCDIIVDDFYDFGEPNSGSPVENAIASAGANGVTYVTLAQNFRVPTSKTPAAPIFGHSADKDAITIASMNILATFDPAVGDYLRSSTEPFSSIGATANKPNVTGPDGGPTTFPLGSGLDPFFGTSAAAPAVAAVAALMMEENPLLETDPSMVDQLLEDSANEFPDSSPVPPGVYSLQTEGTGLVDAENAVALAAKYTGNTATVQNGSTNTVPTGGTTIDTTVDSGGTQVVSSGAIAVGTTVNSGGDETISSGGEADDAVVAAGGVLKVGEFGAAVGTTLNGGEIIISGGYNTVTAGSGGGTAMFSQPRADYTLTEINGSEIDITDPSDPSQFTTLDGVATIAFADQTVLPTYEPIAAGNGELSANLWVTRLGALTEAAQGPTLPLSPLISGPMFAASRQGDAGSGGAEGVALLAQMSQPLLVAASTAPSTVQSVSGEAADLFLAHTG